MRAQVVRAGRPAKLEHVAGVDVGFESGGTIARAAVVVLRMADLVPVDCAIARATTRFPYVPGLLSFREIPVALAALRRLTIEPELILCDAHGYAHPRRFGLACHLGVICGVPTIGVAKSMFIGTHGELGTERGETTPLVDAGEVIGSVVRTRTGVAPVYVSVGHRVDLDGAIALTLACAPRYRLPETTRWAHRLASSAPAISRRLARAIASKAGRDRLPAGRRAL